MMNYIFRIFGGIGILIGIYLFLSNGGTTLSIINTMATNLIDGIQVLQGRDELITREKTA